MARMTTFFILYLNQFPLGAAVSVLDHFQYFDVDYLVCWLNQPQVWLALPASIIVPTKIIPPLPNIVTDFLSTALGFTVNLIGGLV